MKKEFYILTCLIISLNCATTKVSSLQEKILAFSVLYDDEYFKIGDSLQFNEDFIVVEKLKFYISNIQFLNKQQKVWVPGKSAYLLNLEEEKSLIVTMNIPSSVKYDQFKFGLGIDSLTNDNGIGPNDLDPLKGMYWTWNTGYINFKIEGKSSLCKHSSKAFNLHLGGFLNEQLAYQERLFNLNSNQNSINLKLDLKKVFNAVDLSEEHTLMSAGPQSIQISKLIASLFSKN